MTKKRTLNELRQVKTFGYTAPPKPSHGKLGGNLEDAHMRNKNEHDYSIFGDRISSNIQIKRMVGKP